MVMRRLVALDGGNIRYQTRMLKAGDEFVVDGPKARALIALNRAAPAPAARELVADKELAGELEAALDSKPVRKPAAKKRVRKKVADKK